MRQGMAVEQAVTGAVGSGKGSVQGAIFGRGVALRLGAEQDRANQVVQQPGYQVVAEAIKDGARRPQPAE